MSEIRRDSQLRRLDVRFFRNHGLTIVLMTAFAASVVGMVIAGWNHENQQLANHGQAQISVAQYLSDASFWSALFENWESEWLQMAAYVALTAFLFQKGSAESLDPDNPEREESKKKPYYPRSVRGSAVLRRLYEYSLGIALASFFILSLAAHLVASRAAANSEALLHGRQPVSMLDYVGDAQFWFESFQNWQSEFFSTAMLVVLSIFLRFKGSPESKSISARHEDTGG